MRFFLTTCCLALVACSNAATRPQAVTPNDGEWLYTWAASPDTTRRGAFLVQLDLREGSPTAGTITRVIPAGEGSRGTHHSEHFLQPDGLLYADDFGTGRTYIFDLNDPGNPRVKTSFTTAGPYGWPHSYARLRSGNRLVTYQWQKTKFNQPPGGLAEVDTNGTVIRWAAASTEGVEDKEITPYSLELIPSLDRVVSTSTSMIENTGVGVQVWRLSDLKLMHTLRIPADHPHGMHAADSAPHHLFPGEPRLLSDGKTIMFATFTCGLYTLTGADSDNPKVTPVYRFPGKDCAVPVTIGKYWIQTVPATNSLVVLDVSHPASPREVSSLNMGPEVIPHWLAASSSGRRLVVNSGSDADPRLYLVRFDPSTGQLTRDPSLPVLDISRVTVPGLGEIRAEPHGTVFSR